ncbi:MAG: DUF1844 domain-containing protein, partial [Planctomycetes bacterium]|nr:DUF1844 domain-containing protein [Planctomycetota bacterium]
WKAQARAEKEKLAAEVNKPDSAGSAEPGPHQLPPASFAAHVTTLASQALYALGAMLDPETRKPVLDLDLAKYCIDTLRVLEAKTAGNLTDEEKGLLDNTLYELRSRYIHVAQRAAAI